MSSKSPLHRVIALATRKNRILLLAKAGAVAEAIREAVHAAVIRKARRAEKTGVADAVDAIRKARVRKMPARASRLRPSSR